MVPASGKVDAFVKVVVCFCGFMIHGFSVYVKSSKTRYKFPSLPYLDSTGIAIHNKVNNRKNFPLLQVI